VTNRYVRDSTGVLPVPRPLKPYKVDYVYDGKLRVRVEIMFDRDAKLFFAELHTERVQAPSVDECKKLAREMIPRVVQMEWKPYIVVESCTDHDNRYSHHGRTGHNVELSFVFSRLEITKNLQGHMIERLHVLDWPHKDHQRQTSACNQDEDKLIPYSAELWASLVALKEQIEGAGDRLSRLVEDRKNLPARLAAGNVLALPAAPEARRRKAVGR
jgi:hypothetical protein